MLDSEKTFKIKVRSRLTVFEISLICIYLSAFNAVICIERVSHRKEIAHYIQNYKCHEVDQGHSKNLIEFYKSLPFSFPALLLKKKISLVTFY